MARQAQARKEIISPLDEDSIDVRIPVRTELIVSDGAQEVGDITAPQSQQCPLKTIVAQRGIC